MAKESKKSDADTWLIPDLPEFSREVFRLCSEIRLDGSQQNVSRAKFLRLIDAPSSSTYTNWQAGGKPTREQCMEIALLEVEKRPQVRERVEKVGDLLQSEAVGAVNAAGDKAWKEKKRLWNAEEFAHLWVAVERARNWLKWAKRLEKGDSDEFLLQEIIKAKVDRGLPDPDADWVFDEIDKALEVSRQPDYRDLIHACRRSQLASQRQINDWLTRRPSGQVTHYHPVVEDTEISMAGRDMREFFIKFLERPELDVHLFVDGRLSEQQHAVIDRLAHLVVSEGEMGSTADNQLHAHIRAKPVSEDYVGDIWLFQAGVAGDLAFIIRAPEGLLKSLQRLAGDIPEVASRPHRYGTLVLPIKPEEAMKLLERRGLAGKPKVSPGPEWTEFSLKKEGAARN